MLKIFTFYILLFSFNSFSMVPVMVEKPESLYVRQLTPVWCWAATAEAIFNYYHPNDPKSQYSIAMNNPNSYRFDKVEPYVIENIYNDYLLHKVLTSVTHHPEITPFSTKDVKELIRTNNPVIVQQNFHVRIIIGYYEFGAFTNFIVFDPGSYLSFNPDVYLVQEHSLQNEFLTPLAMMMILKPNPILGKK